MPAMHRMPSLGLTFAALLCTGALLGSAGGTARAADEAGFSPAQLERVLGALEGEGFARLQLEQVFHDPRLRRLKGIVAQNALKDDATTRYRVFLSARSLRRARRFLRGHDALLARAERRYGVPRDVVVAILTVETQLGTRLPRHRVLEVLTTLVAAAEPAAIERHYRRLAARVQNLDREHLAQRIQKRAELAYRELVALLQITLAQGKAPREVRGSWAGAMGLAQFLPTSYRQWGVDGNQDGRIDLDQVPDAIASVANYLAAHGWKVKAPLAQKQRAVWHYNPSPQYVETVFAITHRLRLPSAKRVRLRPPPLSPKLATRKGPQPGPVATGGLSAPNRR